nr:MAG: ORF1 [TTV-like mini virus]
MPPFYRRRWRWRPRPKRRTWRTRMARWRPYRPFRRRTYRRQHLVRRKFKRFKLRKLKRLRLNQWQPTTIKKCKIKGYKCLFMAGPDRAANNYAQYQQTYVPEHESGGGGWSLMIFTLEALWEEHMLCRNWWTQSNKGLPLARYNGAKFKFFREESTDYIVSYQLCYPMTDSPLTHANSSPYNMLISRKRFLVPSLETKKRGKPYILKKFRPPSLMKNKWYFQTDICKTGLILITTTAVDLRYFYTNPWRISNNITIHTLNPQIFQNKGFINPDTSGYHPKTTTWYFANIGHEKDPPLKQLSYLGTPGKYTLGKPWDGTNTYFSKPQDWGNIFHPDVLTLNIQVYVTNTKDTVFSEANKDKKVSQINTGLTLVTNPFIIPVRYNPDRDTGQDNVTWLASIQRQDQGFAVPTDENVKIQGLPLHIQLWGWPDWQKKLAYLHQIDSSYLLCIKTPFTEPKLDYIIPIDTSFLNGNGPYNLPHEELSIYTLNSWWPKLAHQLVSIDQICSCGPAVSRYANNKSIQAHCSYNFYFKWGGCPANMVLLTNPCLQPKFPVPDTLTERLQKQNPKYPPELELHEFDERRQELTETCLKRIKEYEETNPNVPSITGACTNPPIKTETQKLQEALIETQTEEKKETSLQQQLQQLKQQQLLLKQCILQQLRQRNIE